MKTPRCKVCGKPLSDPQSISIETGPECAAKANNVAVTLALDAAALGLSEADMASPNVQRQLRLALLAGYRGNGHDYAVFLSAAKGAAQQTISPRISLAQLVTMREAQMTQATV